MKLINLFYACRPQQWIKNTFIFLPALFGQVLFNASVFGQIVLGFICFSFVASSVYLQNDILDLECDKIHPSKRLRALAAGKVSIRMALVGAVLLALIGLICGFVINPLFAVILLSYVLLNHVYSLFLKKIVIIDVFCIGFFFILRLMAGSILSGTVLSHWIIMMTLLLALFLGFNKRRQELKWLKGRAGNHRFVLKKYNKYFIDQMISVITCSITVAYMMYAIDAQTIVNAGSNKLIYTTPFVYYGIFRYLYLIHVRSFDGDPTRIVLSDRLMQLNLVAWFFASALIIYFGF